jgi:catechol 2,3-dioxygenase-like lactoylglutathione lyase family enzyme
MLDHVGLVVSDLDASLGFYDRALAPIGIARLMSVDGPDGKPLFVGFGADRKPFFWLHTGDAPSVSTHVAFTAGSRTMVEDFYAAALAAGGRDNGAPGPRPHYHPTYYGAFVLDPDGNNIEAVNHGF